MRLFVHVILLIFTILNIPAFVNANSSSNSDPSSSDSSSSSGTTSNSSSTETKSQPGSFSEAQDHLETTSAQHASNIPPFETSLDNLSAAERKRIKSREYMREKRKRFPELDREARRRYREARQKDPERKAKKSLSDRIYNIKNKERKRIRDQEYRQRNHESILRKQREARAKQKQLSAHSTKKRKSQKTMQEPSQKKIRLDTSSNAHPIAQTQQSENKASSTLSTPNNQQSQRRNVLRIKLSQETIQKYLSSKKQGSPKQ